MEEFVVQESIIAFQVDHGDLFNSSQSVRQGIVMNRQLLGCPLFAEAAFYIGFEAFYQLGIMLIVIHSEQIYFGIDEPSKISINVVFIDKMFEKCISIKTNLRAVFCTSAFQKK